MSRSGLGLNLLALVLIVLATWFLAVPIFDISIGELPTWLVPSGAE